MSVKRVVSVILALIVALTGICMFTTDVNAGSTYGSVATNQASVKKGNKMSITVARNAGDAKVVLQQKKNGKWVDKKTYTVKCNADTGTKKERYTKKNINTRFYMWARTYKFDTSNLATGTYRVKITGVSTGTVYIRWSSTSWKSESLHACSSSFTIK